MEFTEAAGRRFIQNGPALKENLLHALHRLPESLREEYLTSAERFSGNQTTFIRWMMHNYCLHAGFLQARIALSGNTLFTFGAEIVPWDLWLTDEADCVRQNITLPDLACLRIKRPLPEQQGSMDFDGILPAVSRAAAESVLTRDVIPFLRNYFAFQPAVKDNRYEDLFTHSIEDKVREIIRQSALHGGSVCLTHLRFQDTSSYFDLMGEHRTLETIHSIFSLIRSKIKEKDSVFILSPVSFLIVSPDSDRNSVTSRFADVYFSLGSIIIDYDIIQYTLTEEPDTFFPVWQELRI